MSDHHRPVLAAGLAPNPTAQVARARLQRQAQHLTDARTNAPALTSSFSVSFTFKLVALIVLIGGLTTQLVMPPEAHALPLNIRAKAKVELDHRRTREGLELLGRLTDDRGDPIADERISLELGGREPEAFVTGEDGSFVFNLDRKTAATLERAHGTAVPWSVRFPGSRRFGETVSEGALDLSRRSSRLTLSITGNDIVKPAAASTAPSPGSSGDDPTTRSGVLRVPLGGSPMSLAVRLEDALERSPIAESEIRLKVGAGSELVGATGTTGQATFVLRPELLEAGGRYRITARFEGDLAYVPSVAELDLEVLLPTRLTLRVVREGDEKNGRYRFSGRLADQNGPLRDAVVAIEAWVADAAGKPTDAATPAFTRLQATGPDGLFVTAIDASELHDKKLRRLLVAATFQPAATPHSATRSRPVLLEVPGPPGIPLRWYALALGCLFAVVALARAHKSGALARAWAAIVQWVNALGDRWRTPAPPLARPGEPAFVSADPDTRRTVGRGDHLAGRIVDADEGKGLVATITARTSDALLATTSGPDGRFELGPLPAGAYLVEVAAPGYLPRELALQVPHAGAYDGARWALVAVKRKLRDIFGETVGGLGVDLAWGRQTPREALESALNRHSDRPLVEPPLAELTGLVERAHFARIPAGVTEVDRARTLQRQVEPERPASPRQAKAPT